MPPSVFLAWKIRAHSSCSTFCPASSTTVPPLWKNGFSDSHGSGHCDLLLRSSSTNAAMRSSRMTVPPSVKER
ncbi:hypothetical protein SVIOM342S_00453 [Streptomyces violaceorubidus]